MIKINKPRVVTDHNVLSDNHFAGKYSKSTDGKFRYFPQGAHELCDGFTVAELEILMESMKEAEKTYETL